MQGQWARTAGYAIIEPMPIASDTEDRLTALEIKSSYSEDLLDELNLIIYRQQQQIDRLVAALEDLRRRMPEGGPNTSSHARDEIPPHY